ncbi:YceG family protein [Clostridioides difficile]
MGDSKVFEKIFSSQSDRGNYTPSKGYLSYFISYIGLEDEILYNLEIFKTKQNIDSRKDIALFTDAIANPSDFDIINYFKNGLKNYKNSTEDIDISILGFEEIDYKIKQAIDRVLKEEEKDFTNDRVKQNFIVKIMAWIKTYIGALDINKNDAPKIIFYGDIKKHEVYLLLILYLAGFDVLYLNPNSKSNISILNLEKYKIELEEANIIEENVSFEDRVVSGEKIDKGSVKKAFTVGAEASKRISEELLNDSGFIKPWQLQDRKIKSLLLSSTIDEISIYWNQPLKLRPGFKFNDTIVETPVFFSKINGIYNDKNEYIKFLDLLRDSESSTFVEFNGDIDRFSKEFTREAFSLSFVLNSKGIIDKNSVLNNKEYSISTLALNQQIMILEKVEELIEGNMFLNGLSGEDKIKGLFTVLHMDKRLVHMMNNFDYSLINPKLVIYMYKSIMFDKEVVFLMLLLSKIGFDIIILSPGGENNIENVINNQLIDIHRLDKMVYDLRLNLLEDEIPLLKKIFGKRRRF